MRHSEGLAIAVGAVELAVAGAVIAVAGAGDGRRENWTRRRARRRCVADKY